MHSSCASWPKHTANAYDLIHANIHGLGMQLRLSDKIPWAFALALLPLVIVVIASFRSTTGLVEAANWVRHTQEVEENLIKLLAHVTDAETGMRGFVITGREGFLEPYHQAVRIIDNDFITLQRLIADNKEQLRRLAALKPNIVDKLSEINSVIALRRTQGFSPAQQMVATEFDKLKMDNARAIVAEMRNVEQQLLIQRQAVMDASTQRTRMVLGASAVLGFLIALSASASIRRELHKRRQTEEKLLRAYDDLDERIKQRTEELEQVNANLQREAVERQRTQLLLQQSDQRFRRALTSARMGAWEWELANDRIATYGHLLPLYGLSEHQFAGLRADFIDCIHTDDRSRVVQLLDRAARGEIDFETDFRVVWPDQSIHWLMAKSALMLGDDGKPLHMIGINLEITELKNTQEERERLLVNEKNLRARAEAANRMKDEFLATVSHELRTPLNAILGWTTLLRRGHLDATGVSKALEIVERNAKSQTKLIEDLLDISRIISGQLKLDVQTLDLSGVIRAAIESISPAAEAKQIKLTALLDDAAGPVWGDPQRLQQIAWNLLSNAIKFTPKGGQVQAQLARVASQVEFVVSDTGQGINATFLPHVFERFAQEDLSSKRRHGGLGLGLAIVRQLVELHGGEVSCESEGEGKGSTFRVTLPIMLALRKTLPLDRPLAVDADRAKVSSHPLLNGLNVLVVDDERDARELLAELLGAHGVTVQLAASAVEALAMLKNRRPDVLISDIGMPETDGYELLRELRRNELKTQLKAQLPALALTAYATPEDRMRALQSGFQMHLAKPVDPEELATVLESLTGRLQL
jgi:PAS domain S-box-containing protein